jgi:hypothetical protein
LPAIGPVLASRIAAFVTAEDLHLGRDRAVTYERSV